MCAHVNEQDVSIVVDHKYRRFGDGSLKFSASSRSRLSTAGLEQMLFTGADATLPLPLLHVRTGKSTVKIQFPAVRHFCSR